MAKQSSAPRVDTKYIEYKGGLDTETARVQIPSGTVRESKNVYQRINGGYRTTGGYERFSGKPKPHDAVYQIIAVTITGLINAGDTVTDNDASGSAVVIVNATTYLVTTKLSGTWHLHGGEVKVGGVTQATMSAVPAALDASTRLLDAQYLNLAADNYRADIAPPTGSGSILGVWFFKDNWYCFRNNAGGTAVGMWKASAAGWAAVALGLRLDFTSGGTYVIADGDTITGEISGATAVVGRTALATGSWAAGTAAGRMVFASQTGTFQAETLRVGANLNVATIAGDSAAITIPNPGGRYEFTNGNFTGSEDTQKMYGCDGRNLGFEYDGVNYMPIETGMTSYPTHVYIHKQQLFFSFRGSAQHSQPGLPYEWILVLGAGEIGLGDHITGFISQPGSDGTSALTIFSTSEVSILYGSNISDWNLVSFKQNLGALEWTSQRIGDTIFVDNRGITKLSAAQVYGNFSDSTMSVKFDSYMDSKKNQITATAISREKNLYMIFFDDKTALFCTIVGTKLVSAMEQEFNDKAVCVCSAEDSGGNEFIMIGSDDGNVYELFQGTSFDGDARAWYFYLAHDSLGSPTFYKRYIVTTLDVTGSGYASFQFGYSLEYESAYTPQPALTTREITLGDVFWGSFTWGQFYWDGQTLVPEKFPTMGLATNIGLKFAGSSDYDAELTFNGSLLQFYMTKSTR